MYAILMLAFKMINLLKIFSKRTPQNEGTLETKELSHEELVKELRDLHRTYWKYYHGDYYRVPDFILKDNKVTLEWKDYEQGKIKKFHPNDPKDVWSNTDGSACSVRVDGMFAHIHYIDVMYKPYDNLPSSNKKFQCIKKTISDENKIDYIYNYLSAENMTFDKGISWKELSREECELKYSLIKKNKPKI